MFILTGVRSFQAQNVLDSHVAFVRIPNLTLKSSSIKERGGLHIFLSKFFSMLRWLFFLSWYSISTQTQALSIRITRAHINFLLELCCRTCDLDVSQPPHCQKKLNLLFELLLLLVVSVIRIFQKCLKSICIRMVSHVNPSFQCLWITLPLS